MKFFSKILTLSLLLSPLLASDDLLRDLLIVEAVTEKVNDRLPVFFNNYFQGGYINMPSARMGLDGEVGGGFSYIPPYRIYSMRVQFYDRVEFSGNYRIFEGIKDPILSAHGFGDFSDKGVNVKFALLFPEETNYRLPGISIGWDDFLGTKAFQSRYIVLTQVLPEQNIEATLGFGDMRISGWFGGFSWMPLRRCCSIFSTLCLTTEYDATDYHSKKREPHPRGRDFNSRFNYGVKWRLLDVIDLSAAYVRGKTFSYGISASYNLGHTSGILPKICDPPLYRAPVNVEPIGDLRTEEMFIQDLFWALRCQGFFLMESSMCCDVLYLRILNEKWRWEDQVRGRLNNLMAFLIPTNIQKVVVVMDGPGFELQRYVFCMDFVRRFGEGKLSPYELKVLTPLQDPLRMPQGDIAFWEDRSRFCTSMWPKFISFFGSAKGKFKYAWGGYASLDGYLFNSLRYSVQGSYTVGTNLDDVKDVDKLNPSQLINVRTDLVNYLKQPGFSLEEAYVQRSFAMKKGFFSRIAGGIFELMYGGVGGEVLHYPANSPWAWGIEAAWLKKRTYTGVGFTNKIRKLNGYVPEYVRFHGAQAFFNLYYNVRDFNMDIQLKAGKYLANDVGAGIECSRYFPSGTRIYFWYTVTNGHDKVNGHTYFDKGVGISIPLDIFSKCSSKRRWTYGMAAWLRDVGQSAYTGESLFWTIRNERERVLRGDCRG